MHALNWFWTTGRHNPAWVQAIASVTLVVLTLATLIGVVFYVLDTRKLAKASVEQMDFLRRERESIDMRETHRAYDCILKVQHDLITLFSNIADENFGQSRLLPIYPKIWPEVTSALHRLTPAADDAAIGLGNALRNVDHAVGLFSDCHDDEQKQSRKSEVILAAQSAVKRCQELHEHLPKADPKTGIFER